MCKDYYDDEDIYEKCMSETIDDAIDIADIKTSEDYEDYMSWNDWDDDWDACYI